MFFKNTMGTSSSQHLTNFASNWPAQIPRVLHQVRDGGCSESDSAAPMSDSDFTTVENRQTRRKNKRLRTSTSSPVNMTLAHIVANGSNAMNNSGRPAAPTAPISRPYRPALERNNRIMMIGRSTTSRMTAATKLTIPKEVFRIANIGGEFTEDDMENYLEYIGVHVQTCFDRTPLIAKKKNNKVFRVCILSIDRDKLLSENNWSRGIIIQQWRFNTDKNGHDREGIIPPPPPSSEAVAHTDDVATGGGALLPSHDCPMDDETHSEPAAPGAEGVGATLQAGKGREGLVSDGEVD